MKERLRPSNYNPLTDVVEDLYETDFYINETPYLNPE